MSDEKTSLMLSAFLDRATFEYGLSGDGSIFLEPDLLGDSLIPGCGDLQVATITRIGHRGEFPMAREWENLLSMLLPGQELLWIVRKNKGKVSCHLALKDLRAPRNQPNAVKEVRHEFRALIDHFTRRAFPESLAGELSEESTIRLLDQIMSEANREVVVTSGQPSPSEIEDSRDFPEAKQSPTPDGMLNDMVEPFAGEENFTIVFTVARASDEEITNTLVDMTDVRSAISPLLKVQDNRNSSVSDTKNKAQQHGKNTTTGQNTTRNIIATLHQKVFGSDADEVLGTYLKHNDDLKGGAKNLITKGAKAVYRGYFQKFLRKAGTSHQNSTTESMTVSVGETRQQGTSQTLTTANAMLELVDNRLQECIRCFKRASGTGGYHLAAEVFSPRTDLSLRIARSIAGSLSGAKTHLRPFQTAIYRGDGYANHLTRRRSLKEAYGAVTLQSSHIAALFLPLPESDLPGLKTKRNVFYGKPNPVDPVRENDESVKPEPKMDDLEKSEPKMVWLGELAHLKSGFKSQYSGFTDRSISNSRFEIPAVDLTSHILIAGTTGSGKTQRAAAILNQLPTDSFQIVVIESAKKTYRTLLKREGVNRRILELGGEGERSLRLNPFFFEPGTHLRRHISILSDALADLLPVEALVGPKIREAIQNCYENYCWDIQTGEFRGDGPLSYPTMADLHLEVMAVATSLNYSAEMNSNYKGALLGRTRLFIDSLYQDIFGWGGDQPLDDLFGDGDVIIEMDSLPPSEAKMPSFVLSVLLERMRARQELLRKAGRGKDLLIVIEEAHNLLDRRLEAERPGTEMGSGGFLLKQIIRILQEGRETGLGVMVVDQSPASLADAVIRNTNTKIIMRISDSEEAEKIGSTLGLTKEESRDLHDLEDGEAVIKVKNAGKALKLAPMPEILKKVNAPASEAKVKIIDYYLAAKKIREIFDHTLRPLKKGDAEMLMKSIGDLLAYDQGIPSARRYLARKLLIAVTEKRDKVLSFSPSGFDDVGGLMLAIVDKIDDQAAKALNSQLSAILSRKSWADAADCFKTDSSAAVDVGVEELKQHECWRLMGAADRFKVLLTGLQPGGSSLEQCGIGYSHLSYLIHISDSRFTSIQKLISDLTPEKP